MHRDDRLIAGDVNGIMEEDQMQSRCTGVVVGRIKLDGAGSCDVVDATVTVFGKLIVDVDIIEGNHMQSCRAACIGGENMFSTETRSN